MIAVMGALLAMSTSANANSLDVEALVSAQAARPLHLGLVVSEEGITTVRQWLQGL